MATLKQSTQLFSRLHIPILPQNVQEPRTNHLLGNDGSGYLSLYLIFENE